jgi:hypothetical protein
MVKKNKTTKGKSNSNKTATKAKKSTSKTTTKVRRQHMNECVAFVFGGDIMKTSNIYVFAVDTKDPVPYIKENLVQFYGSNVGGRYVKCVDSEDTLEQVLSLADERGYRTENGCNFLKVNVNNGSALLRDAAGVNVAHAIKLENTNKKQSKKTKKSKTKDSEDEESESSDNDEDNVDNEDDVSNEEDEDASDTDEGDKSESDEEDKPSKPVSKSVKNKGKNKSTKSSRKSKQSSKAKNVKKRK